jgi:hypothetical protein
MHADVDIPGARRRWWRRAILLVVGVGGAFLVFPYARALVWLNLRPAPPGRYVIPVPGVRAAHLAPNYGAPRGFGAHEGIDIVAPAGTSVLSAADGIVVDDDPTEIGGNVIWILGSGRQLYYYAHLQGLARGMREGRHVKAGERLGAIGNSGNAVATSPHLHFSIYRVTSGLLPLRSEPVDPYPLLVAAGETQALESSPLWAPSERRAPDDFSLPFDPEEALGLAPEAIAEQADAAASRVRALLGKLDLFLGVDSDVDARVVQRFYALAPRLRALAAKLRASAEGVDERPLRDLGWPVRDDGIRLFHASRRLNELLDERTRCVDRDFPVFLSAVETLAVELEVETPPARTPAPRLDYYVFDGHRPNVFPRGGGWAFIVGAHLWEGGEPRVSLVAPDRRSVLASVDAHRTRRGEAIAISVGAELVADYGGECLFLRLGLTKTTGRLWWRTVEARADLELPLCIPKSFVSQYRVAGFLGYRIPTGTRVLESDEILFFNESCDERKPVSQTLEWPLHPGGRLVANGQSKLYEINDSSVACRIEENRITCSGWLDRAACDTGTASGKGRVDTEWHHLFSPTEEYPDLEEHRSSVLSPGVDASDEILVCVEIPRDEATDETRMWFDLFAVNGHQQRNIFSSPRTNVRDPSREHYEVGPHRIAADFEPGLETGEGRICVSIRSAQCRY